MEYPIPNHSSTAFRIYRNLPNAVLNAGLIFERYAPKIINSDAKKEGLIQTIAAAQKSDPKLLKSQAERWGKTAAAIHAVPFTLLTDWRMVAGFGHKGALEVGFTFNRYGFPILPGSSLKGIARTFALIELAEKITTQKLAVLEDTLLKAENDFLTIWEQCYPDATTETYKLAVDFRDIFGTTDFAGKAVFLDSIPVSHELPKLELDVMTPHYNQYYQENRAPTDNKDPIPIPFMVVAARTPFQFAVGWRTIPDEDRKTLRDLAVVWLTKGLQKMGAGAKTSSGYGFFSEDFQGGAISLSRSVSVVPIGYRRGKVQKFGEGPHQSYGYIKSENGEEIFVHRSQLADGIVDLQPDQKVYFKVKFDKGKPQAHDVHLEKDSK